MVGCGLGKSKLWQVLSREAPGGDGGGVESRNEGSQRGSLGDQEARPEDVLRRELEERAPQSHHDEQAPGAV